METPRVLFGNGGEEASAFGKWSLLLVQALYKKEP